MPTTNLLTSCKVCWWRPVLRTQPPTVLQVQRSLRDEGFTIQEDQRGRLVTIDLAEPVPWSTAARRAVGNLENKDTKASFKNEGSVLHCQLDRVFFNEHKRQVRELIAHWKLTGGEHPTFSLVEGDGSGITDMTLHQWRTVYQWGDVSEVLMRVINKHGFGAYPLRSSGGVYFIPMENITLIQRFERACLQFNMNFFHLDIPDDEKYKTELEESIFAALDAEVEVHLVAIAGYHQETKIGHIDNRLTAIGETRRLIENLATHLRRRRTELLNKIDDARARAERAKQVATEFANQGRAVGGRRIIATRS